MPVIVPRELWATSLCEHGAEPDELLAILRPYPAERA
jgi:hypothetical protein